MDSKVTTATVQATVLNALSGVFAQGILAYRKGAVDEIDFSSILRFIVYTVLTTPPNYRWQEFLEQTFPTTTEPKGDKTLKDKSSPSPSQDAVTAGKLNIANTAAKFFLDQGLGAPVNTLLFICLMGQMNLQGYDGILSNVVSDFWPMLFAGYRVWPLVCLLNLVVVPFDYRQLVGSIAGLGWGVFLSLSQMK
ncbi:hypothetical protein M441DRAFT_141676 [Trichoderma asperellum CBS 433.97]|uniref:Integral membrane protein, Mpv17/PMP22 family n=1 Tax=Trichoderma asperellum (strain ATCC 204424 / CBS 433.97 / NBRC 101777) TaxID=1042311 RepID=A0A2T3Z4Z6_TRIA4|nr:hypothetical protein M441DRAFT_141676 [Trichoderma asperellum CBS 433.97]PTB39865.1 hypothetical protein M441DRAFT_141676 [Trichoderma asperellum CBS 433.97]